MSSNIFNFPVVYLYVNTYTGETKYLSLEEGESLGGYWERETQRLPHKKYIRTVGYEAPLWGFIFDRSRTPIILIYRKKVRLIKHQRILRNCQRA